MARVTDPKTGQTAHWIEDSVRCEGGRTRPERVSPRNGYTVAICPVCQREIKLPPAGHIPGHDRPVTLEG